MQRALVSLVLAIAAAMIHSDPVDAAGMTLMQATDSAPAAPIYLAIPRGPGPFPAVLVLHGCEGFNAFYAYTVDKLAMSGYVGIAIDSVGPDAPDGACRDRSGSEIEAHEAARALGWLRTQSFVKPDRLALLGYSMGGIATLDLIDSTKSRANAPVGVRAAVAFYPNCVGFTGDVAVPLAIFDGSADQIAPAASCAALAAHAKGSGSSVDLTTYPGATHGFVIPGEHDFFGQPIRFDRDATDASAAATKAFLAKYL